MRFAGSFAFAQSPTSLACGRVSSFPAMCTSSRNSSAGTPSGASHAFPFKAIVLTDAFYRTMKKAVKDELTIPPQTRYLVPIELGRVERHFYDQALDAALLDLGLDARGVAATENWEVNVMNLRHWLRRLRGLCTHPQVGELAVNGVDKLHKPGVLKSMSEVLETMREQNWRNFAEDRKDKVGCVVIFFSLFLLKLTLSSLIDL